MTRKDYTINITFFILTVLLSSCRQNQSENNNLAFEQVKKNSNPDSNKVVSHKNAGSTIEVTATELTSDYVANEVKADYDYKGKLIIVTGEIIDIKKGIADDIFVVLKGSERHRSVQCYYDDEKDVQRLKKGMKISFKGICDGLWVNVILSDCERILKSDK